jgi:hypothetical protein
LVGWAPGIVYNIGSSLSRFVVEHEIAVRRLRAEKENILKSPFSLPGDNPTSAEFSTRLDRFFGREKYFFNKNALSYS